MNILSAFKIHWALLYFTKFNGSATGEYIFLPKYEFLFHCSMSSKIFLGVSLLVLQDETRVKVGHEYSAIQRKLYTLQHYFQQQQKNSSENWCIALLKNSLA